MMVILRWKFFYLQAVSNPYTTLQSTQYGSCFLLSTVKAKSKIFGLDAKSVHDYHQNKWKVLITEHCWGGSMDTTTVVVTFHLLEKWVLCFVPIKFQISLQHVRCKAVQLFSWVVLQILSMNISSKITTNILHPITVWKCTSWRKGKPNASTKQLHAR